MINISSIHKKISKRIIYSGTGIIILIYLFLPIFIDESPSNIQDIGLEEPIEQDSFSNTNKPHWGELPITYKFQDNSSLRQMNLLHLAFKKIEEETSGIVYFKEVQENEDISIYFKKKQYIGNADSILADARITEIDRSKNLILKGELNIYGQGFVCVTGYPALEIHEILHLFKFPHNPLVTSIMHPYSSESSKDCKTTKIDDEYIICLKHLYSNGTIEGSCDFPNTISYIDFQDSCTDGYYPSLNSEDYCCPEPDMKIIEGYCNY